MTWEWYRHMRPDRTLVVVPDAAHKAGLVSHVDRFPDADRIRLPGDGSNAVAGELDERTCRRWLDGLDVVYTAETFYDWRFCDWAEDAGVATVCHVMPEYVRPDWLARPTQWWAPTSYRLDALPEGTRLVPVPIPTDRWPEPKISSRPLRWLHVAGAQTTSDRNGTRWLMRAFQFVSCEQHVTIRTQDDLPYTHQQLPPRVHLTVDRRNLRDYWRLYDDADALVMPRRYAGLCLPVLEGIGAGLGVVMTDLSPQNTDWPVSIVKTNVGDPLRLPTATIPTGDVDPFYLAELMDEWVTTPQLAAEAQERSIEYARAHSWEALEPVVRAELERVVRR